MSRRRFLKLGAMGAIVVVVAGVGTYFALQPRPAAPTPVATPKPAPAAPPPPPVATPSPSPSPVTPKPSPTPTPTMIELAKKEGTVMVYTPWGVTTVEVAKKAFETKYPDIKVEYVRGFAPLLERALTEARAGKHTMDVWMGSYGYALSFMEAGIPAKYTSAVDAEYPAELKDPSGKWVSSSAGIIVISHHKGLPQEKIPQNYYDVLKPEFKDRIGIFDPNFAPYLLVTMEQKIIGPDKWMSWLQAFKAQNPKMAQGSFPLATLIINREADIGLLTYLLAVTDNKAKGAPIDYVSAPGTVMGEAQVLMVNKDAPHPNAARLFRDFALSKEGVKAVADEGVYIPLRTDVPSAVPRIKTEDVVQSPRFTFKDLEDARAKYNSVFK